MKIKDSVFSPRSWGALVLLSSLVGCTGFVPDLVGPGRITEHRKKHMSPPVPGTVLVGGLVLTPGPITLTDQGLTLSEAVQAVGGFHVDDPSQTIDPRDILVAWKPARRRNPLGITYYYPLLMLEGTPISLTGVDDGDAIRVVPWQSTPLGLELSQNSPINGGGGQRLLVDPPPPHEQSGEEAIPESAEQQRDGDGSLAVSGPIQVKFESVVGTEPLVLVIRRVAENQGLLGNTHIFALPNSKGLYKNIVLHEGSVVTAPSRQTDLFKGAGFDDLPNLTDTLSKRLINLSSTLNGHPGSARLQRPLNRLGLGLP